MNNATASAHGIAERPPGQIYAAVTAMIADLSKSGLAKDATNTFDNYAYRSVDALRQVIGHLQGVHGVAILPTMLDSTTTERETKDGRLTMHTIVRMSYRFVAAADGSSFTVETQGEGADRGDKSIAKAVSSSYKTVMLQIFAVGDGTDADSDSHELTAQRMDATRAMAKARNSKPAPAPSESEAAEIESNLRDAIESADTMTEIEALGRQMQALPESIKSHLRSPWNRRRDELRELQYGRTGGES